MIRIRKSNNWGRFEQIFGKQALKRLDWFRFEFGKRITSIIHQELLGNISTIKGSKAYKKRLVVAEMRQGRDRSWWAIVARSGRMIEGQMSAETTILKVLPRFEAKETDPVYHLERFGPYTVETLPYVPSQREAQVVSEKASKDQVHRVRDRNYLESRVLESFLLQLGVEYENRDAIYEKLKIIEDLEAKAIGWEFGTIKGGKSHWRPAIRFARTRALSILKTDHELIKAFTDPNFRGFKRFRHLHINLKRSEVKTMRRFQDLLNGGKGPKK